MKIEEALTFDDVLLVPAHSTVLPDQVSLATRLTRSIELPIPIMSSPMDTVTEASLAISLAQEGGIGIIHRNMSIETQASQVKQVKKYESGVVNDPITVNPNTTIEELLALNEAHKISGLPVVDGDELVGIVTRRDIRFELDLQRPVSEVMTGKDKLVTVPESAEREQAIALLQQHRIERVLIVNDDFQLRGMITYRDIQQAKDRPNACKDSLGQLRVGAAVGTGADTQERVDALISASVDVIVVDTAHGHSQSVLDTIAKIKQQHPDSQVIGGNIVTAEAAIALVEAGADGVKVGIGPGSICTTRVVSGVGMPQITAIQNVSHALRDTDIPVIADGGVRYSGDLGKAIAAGAHSIMMGSLFAGTEESPGTLELYQGRSYKTYRGMGSIGAMVAGSSDRYFQDNKLGSDKLVPQGIEGRVPYKGKLGAVIHQILGGLRSSMGYTGMQTVAQMREHAKFVRVTNAGIREGHAHDVSITKEAPNYWVES